MAVRVLKITGDFRDTYINGCLFNEGIFTTTDNAKAEKLLSTGIIEEIVQINQKSNPVIVVDDTEEEETEPNTEEITLDNFISSEKEVTEGYSENYTEEISEDVNPKTRGRSRGK